MTEAGVLRLKHFFLLFSFERQQSLVQEQLAKLAQRESESAATTSLDELTPAFITGKEEAFKEQENANILVRDVVFLFTYRSHNTWSAETYNEMKTPCISLAVNTGRPYLH